MQLLHYYVQLGWKIDDFLRAIDQSVILQSQYDDEI